MLFLFVTFYLFKNDRTVEKKYYRNINEMYTYLYIYKKFYEDALLSL